MNKTSFNDKFNKEIYINAPISISDNNLFFHYLRVKFFQFLKRAFGIFLEKLIKFCINFYDKIMNMTLENEPNLKTRLLLKILSMVTIYGCIKKKIMKYLIITSMIYKLHQNYLIQLCFSFK